MFQKLKALSADLTVYGMGDVAIQVVNFLLLPVYVLVLTPTDYGVLAGLLIVEQILRVVYRWGVDASFMRYYYDCHDTAARQRLASTIFFFLIVASGGLMVAGVTVSPLVANRLFESPGYGLALQLVFLTTFLSCLSFLPFHVMRIEGKAGAFVSLTFTANLSTLIAKLVFVVGLRLGVLGIYLSDLVVAVGIIALLLPRFIALIRPVFSMQVLRQCLRFGLPRLPHGIAHQVIAGADRYFLLRFCVLRDVGIYFVGANLGLGMKLFLSAFENAWAPFYFSEMKQPDAKQTFRTVTTYGMTVLLLMVAGLSAVAYDLVRLMTKPEFYGAARFVPWIALGVALQGVYLLTSIGLNITKRTVFYPISTGIAAVASVAASLILIPRFGVEAAAWSNAIAYAVLAGTAMWFSQRVYPISYDWGRLARVVVAALLSIMIAKMILPLTVMPIIGVLVRGSVVVASFTGILALLGFFEPREIGRLKSLGRRLWRKSSASALVEEDADGDGPVASEARTDRNRAALAASCLAAVLVVAVVLRVLGIGFGLPQLYNADEVSIMSRALAFAKGSLNPHNFLYPTFYFYALFAWIGGYFVVAWLSGAVASLSAFQTGFFTDPSHIYLAGRCLSVACGVLSVALVYRLGRRLAGRAAGLAAALFMAVSPFAVRDAHYVKHDVPAALAVVAAYLALFALDACTGSHRRRWLVTAGAACGVAFSVHYYTVFLALPLAMAAIAGERRPWAALRDLLIAGGAATVAFFALSPFLLVDFRTALSDMAANRSIVVDRAVGRGHGLFVSARTYADMFWRDAVGWPVFLLSLAGIPVLVARSRRRAVLLFLFPVAFMVFIANTIPATRYLNAVIPFVAVSAGAAIAAFARMAGGRLRVVALVVCVLAAVPGATSSLASGMFFRQTDTRTLALRFVERWIPPGSGVAVQPYSVPVPQSRESLIESLRANVGDEKRASAKFQLRLALNPYQGPGYRTIYIGDGGLDADKIYVGYAQLGGTSGLSALRAHGVTCVIVKRYSVASPETAPFLAALGAEGRLLATFSPYRPGTVRTADNAPEPYVHNTDARITAELERPGPVIEIWQLPDRTS